MHAWAYDLSERRLIAILEHGIERMQNAWLSLFTSPLQFAVILRNLARDYYIA